MNDAELDEYKKIRLPMILVLKASHQSRFDEFNTKYITPIYEPINVTKITKALEQNRALLPKIEVPKEEIAKQEVKASPRTTKPKFGKIFHANVLVAEDNEINQKLIRRTLEGLGLTITIAHNGKIALEERMKNDYDAVFMDIAMPVMDGVESTHKMLEYEKENNLPHIPIIAVTANALKGDRERFMKEGLDEYVTKPIKKESILSVLNMFLQDKIAQEDEKIEIVEKVEDKPVITPLEIVKEEKIEVAPLLDEEVIKEQKAQRDIIVFKKSPIETKIFSSVLTKISSTIDSVNTVDELKEKLNKSDYKVILFDKETSSTSPDKMATLIGNTPAIMFVDSMSETDEKDKALFKNVLSNVINKQQLEELIQKFI